MRVCLMAGLALIAGCMKPRIDGATAESARSTIAAVRASLGDEHRTTFDRDLDVVMTDGGKDLPVIGNASVRKRIDGKNADGIAGAAAQIRQRLAEEAHERSVKQAMAKLDARFAAVDAADRAAGRARLDPVSPPVARATDLGIPQPKPDPAMALMSETPLTDDPAILSLCGRFDSQNTFARRSCEQDEMNAKQKLAAFTVPQDFPSDQATRLRSVCTRASPDSYRGRLACVQTDMRIVMVSRVQPRVIDTLPQEQRDQVTFIVAGTPPAHNP